MKPEELKGVPVHETAFCHWKLESCWDSAIFVRQKTYIEHITHENLEPIDEPYNNIKCAGMPSRSKKIFELSMQGTADKNKEWSEEEKEFLFDKNGNAIKRTYEDFTIGLQVPNKLVPKRIKGGVVLVDTTYKLR